MANMTVLIRAGARLLLAPALMVAAAVIVKGYADVGDGFSAAVIVGLGLAVQYLALGPREAERALPFLRFAPAAAVTGLLIALAVGFAPLLAGQPVFSHWPPKDVKPVTVGTLELITAVALDVGVFLLVTGVLVVLLHQLAVPGDDR
jgi:multicomponent Na+:H+ antiporter subunit B